MRILHTSDWHLGRKFGEHPLLGDQRAFLDWLVSLAVDRAVDLVVVSGDLYDRSVPPAEAVQLFGDTLRLLHQQGIGFVGIAGNHDSSSRLAAFDGITHASGVLLGGGYQRSSEVAVVQVGGFRLAIAAVPFLDPLMSPFASEGRLSHEEVLRTALCEARKLLPEKTCSLVLAHAFVAGGQVSDSERELSVGTAGTVSADIFDGFDYVALGHLHSPQAIAGHDHLRYSGSPLAYSFSETVRKSVCLVELADEGFVSVESVLVPVGRGVQTVSGDIADLVEGPQSDLWTRVELTDKAPVLDAQRRLRDRFPFVVEIARLRSDSDADSDALSMSQVRELAPEELAAAFWLEVEGEALSDDESALLNAALAAADSSSS
ncbi:MAG: exonuclease SbcCD subunit D [Acidimicrobiales bacterium]